MSHPLHQRIASIAWRARLLVVVRGLCWFVTAVALTVICLGLADYWLRFGGAVSRVLGFFTLVGVVVGAWQRFVHPLFSRQHDDVSVAQHVERRFPQFGDRLSSSIAFLSQSSAAAQFGSLGLQQAVVTETEQLADRVDFAECLNSKATRRAILCAIPVLMAGVLPIALDRDSSLLALRRLVMPWSNEAWPRWNELAFDSAPSRLATGQDFAVTLQDANGHLPSHAVIQYWFEGDPADKIEARRMARTKAGMRDRRENVTRSFRYRAFGGDDDTMQWLSLEVVEPPTAEQLRLQVRPPDYSGLPPLDLPGGNIQILSGSSLGVTARASRPLTSAYLTLEGLPEAIRVPAELDADRRSLSIPTVPLDHVGAGRYWLELLEGDSVSGGHETQANWRVVADSPPEIVWANPLDGEVLTPLATQPLQFTVTDDLAVKSVALLAGGERTMLYEGPESAPARERLSDPHDERAIDYTWELAQLNLQPKDILEVSVVATDYKGQEQRTPTRRLRVVTAEEFAQVLEERQKHLRQQLAEALRTQDNIRARATTVKAAAVELRELVERDVAMLQGCELQQRQVERLLGSDAEGAATHVDRLLAAIENNRVDETESIGRLSDFAARLLVINHELVPGIRSALVRAAKAATSETVSPEHIAEILEESDRDQAEVVAALQQMIDRLSSWDDYRRFAREVSRLLQAQQDLADSVDKLSTLGKRLDELSVADRSDLLHLSGEQGEVLRQLERQIGEMHQFAERSKNNAPTVAATLEAASRAAAEHELAEHMQRGKQALSQNQIGSARRNLREAVVGLEAVLATLSGRPTSDQAEQARRLDETASRLNALVSDQHSMRERLEATGQLRDAAERQAASVQAARAQRDLVTTANEITDALNRLGVDEAATAARQGAAAASQAADAAEADEHATAVASAGEAEQRFADAGQQVADRLQQTRERLLKQTRTRLTRAIEKLVIRQRALNETFAAQRDQMSEPSGAALLGQLAEAQEAVAVETDQVRESFQPPKAFGLALSWAARSMRIASERFLAGEASEEASVAQQAAVRQLELLLDGLRRPESRDGTTEAEQGSPQGQGGGKPSKYSAAELRVVLGMQTEIHARTRDLAASDESRRQVAADQQSLARLVAELSRKTSRGPADALRIINHLDDEATDTTASPQTPLREADRSLDDLFDNRLLEGLDAPPPTAGEDLGQPSSDDPLPAIAERMDQVASRVRDDEVLTPALQTQQEIIAELQELVAQADQQTSQQAATPKPIPKPTPGEGENVNTMTDGGAGSPSTQDAMDAVWGSLPERLRQQIKSPLQEEFLPPYEHVIEEYYKRLAEEQRARGER